MLKKVKSVTEGEILSGANKGAKYFKVVFDDNVMASGFDADFLGSEGKELDVEITEKGQYKNVKVIKSSSKAGKPFVSKNPRETAMGFAVSFCSSRPNMEIDGCLQVAEKILAWVR
jgi:hypothetical protein